MLLAIGGGIAAVCAIALAAVVGVFFLTSSSTQAPGDSTVPTHQSYEDMVEIFGPMKPFEKPASANWSDTTLHYDFEGAEYPVGYEVQIESRTPDGIETVTGHTIYNLSSRSAPTTLVDANKRELPLDSTGTGFVIRPDGYLVTCAHVIEDAGRIRARLGNKEYDAFPVAIDVGNDLAILRVDAQNLRHIPIASPGQARLAEDVTAIGFPLTSHLGESMKVTRGSISGLDSDSGRDVLQLDVAVNPGNSGGPLFNSRGQIAGVVSALLSGFGISEVSFAVSTSALIKMLEENNLKYEKASHSAKQKTAQEVSTRYGESVAFIKVRRTGDKLEFENKSLLEFRSKWTRTLKRPDGKVMKLGGADESGDIIVDSAGKVFYSDAKQNLTLGLGPLSLLPMHPLPSDIRDEWAAGKSMRVQAKVDPGDSGKVLGQDGNVLKSYQESTRTIPVHQVIEIKSDGTRDARGQRFSKMRRIISPDTGPAQATLSVYATGNMWINDSLPSALKMSGDLTTKFQGRVRTSKFKLSYNRVDAADLPAETIADPPKPLPSTVTSGPTPAPEEKAPPAVAPLVIETHEFPLRKWQSKDGRFSIEARFAGVYDGKVALEKEEGGKRIDVPVASLSEADGKYAAKAAKEVAARDFLKPFEQPDPRQPEYKKVAEFRLGADLRATSPTSRVAVCADGSKFVFVSHQAAGAYDLQSGAPLPRFKGTIEGSRSPIAISPDGKYGVVAHGERRNPREANQPDRLYVWDLQTGETVHTHVLPEEFVQVKLLAVSPDSKHVICRAGDSPYYSAPLQASAEAVLTPAGGNLPDVVLSRFPPYNKDIFQRSVNSSKSKFGPVAHVRDDELQILHRTPDGFVEMMTSTSCNNAEYVRLTKDRRYVVLARTDGRVVVHDLGCIRSRKISETGICDALSISDDGATVVQIRSRLRKHHFTSGLPRDQIEAFKRDPVIQVWKVDAFPQFQLSKFANAIHELLRNKEFDKLEAIAAYLAPFQTPFPWSTMATRYDEFFTAIRSPSTSAVYASHRDSLREWNKERRDTTTIKQIYADEVYRAGWKVRGEGFASTVSAANMKQFALQMQESGSVLKQLIERHDAPARTFSQLFDIAKAASWSPEEIDKYIGILMERFPQYYPAHQAVVQGYLPRWGGMAGEAEQYAGKIADEIGGVDGDAMYARLADIYAFVNQEEVVKSGGFDLRRIRRGAELLYSQNPKSDDAIDRKMYYAYLHGDKATAIRLAAGFGREKISTWRTGRWGSSFHAAMRDLGLPK